MKTLYTGTACPNPAYMHTPLIEIQPVQDDSRLRQVASSMDAYDYLLFTSRYAVEYFLNGQQAAVGGHSPQIVSIGKTTTAALLRFLQRSGGVTQVDRDNSYGVIEWFAKQPRGRVLIPRSNLALDIIPDGLRNLGYEVDTVTAYINRMPQNLQKVNLQEIDRIVFTSPSTIDNFICLYGALPEGVEFVTRGPVTEQHLQTIIKQQQV